MEVLISDKNIVDGLIMGKDAAIQYILDTYSDRVYSIAMDYLKKKEDAEEVTQDVFMAMIHKAGSFKFQSSLSTWIYRMAVNKSMDYLKHQKRKRRSGQVISLSDSEESVHLAPNDIDPETILVNMNKEQIILRALNQLSENQKTAIILVRMEGLAQKEAAEIMNINIKALESLLQRGQMKLREILSKVYDQF